MIMETTNNNHDKLAGKKRFVQSLTRSRRFLNDDTFLTPVTKNTVVTTNDQSTQDDDLSQKEAKDRLLNNHHESNPYY
jgi:hypothetical protein